MVAEALNANRAGWICDGNYTSKVPDLILPQAGLVICLRLSFVVTYWRLLTRTVRRVWTRRHCGARTGSRGSRHF